MGPGPALCGHCLCRIIWERARKSLSVWGHQGTYLANQAQKSTNPRKSWSQSQRVWGLTSLSAGPFLPWWWIRCGRPDWQARELTGSWAYCIWEQKTGDTTDTVLGGLALRFTAQTAACLPYIMDKRISGNKAERALAQRLEVGRVAEAGGILARELKSQECLCMRRVNESRWWKEAKAAQVLEAWWTRYDWANTGYPLRCA